MPKRKNLNGLPHNLAKSYFSTLRYSNGGYMADWLLSSAKNVRIDTVILDILNLAITPKEVERVPLMDHLIELKWMLQDELSKRGFDSTFITEAKIIVRIPDKDIYAKTIYCYPELRDETGRQYKCGRIIETAYEVDGRNFKKSLSLKGLILRAKRLFNFRQDSNP